MFDYFIFSHDAALKPEFLFNCLCAYAIGIGIGFLIQGVIYDLVKKIK